MTDHRNDWTYLASPNATSILETLQAWSVRGDAPGILAFVCDTTADLALVPALQRAATQLDMPLGGVIVPGVLIPGAFKRSGILLTTRDRKAASAIVPLPSEDGRTTDAASDALIAFVDKAANPDGGDMLMLLMDVAVPDAASLIDRVYLEIGDLVTYAGMCAGSESFTEAPCIFDNTRFVREAVLALIQPAHPGATLAHHYRGNEALWVATVAKGGLISTIGGRPAFEVYQELMTKEYGITLDRQSFYEYSVHFPFALNRAQGESLVRIPVRVEEDGSVYCSGEIRENSLVSVVRAVPAGEVSAAAEVGEGVGVHGAASVLLFYCAGRFLHLGEDAAALEVEAIRAAAGTTQVYGALCLGEIGALKHQYPAFHNCTLTAMPWI